MPQLDLTPQQIIFFKQVVARFLDDDEWIKTYFGYTGAEKKAYQIGVIDQKIAAIQTQIDNIDTFVAAFKTQRLAELNAQKSVLSNFKTVWEQAPE